jgi:hypothetical protein
MGVPSSKAAWLRRAAASSDLLFVAFFGLVSVSPLGRLIIEYVSRPLLLGFDP